jgi:hypothetical protein
MNSMGLGEICPTEIASHKLTNEVLQALSNKMLVGGIFVT